MPLKERNQTFAKAKTEKLYAELLLNPQTREEALAQIPDLDEDDKRAFTTSRAKTVEELAHDVHNFFKFFTKRN